MDMILRATAIYFVLLLLTRALGKRAVSEMTGFELVLLVVMGDIVQQGVTGEDMSVTGGVIAISTMGFWVFVFSVVSWRFRKLRRAVDGLPVVIIRDGKPLDEALRIERMPLDELLEAARNQGIGDLDEVLVGVLEPDGRMSFIKRDGEQAPPSEPPAARV